MIVNQLALIMCIVVKIWNTDVIRLPGFKS